MHCENCGASLRSEDKFCTKCGTPVHKAAAIPVPSVSEEKWWYRLLKVAYILLYVISIGIVLVVSYSAMPHRTLNGDLSTIQCDNGKSYAPSKNSIYLFSETLSYSDDQDARILCAYDTTNYYSSYYRAPSYKNYTFYPHYDEADYSSWFFGSLVALLITWGVLKLIRIGVQYIAFGNKPRWGKEIKKLY